MNNVGILQIEHAQHLAMGAAARFSQQGIIASVQVHELLPFRFPIFGEDRFFCNFLIAFHAPQFQSTALWSIFNVMLSVGCN